MRTAIEDKAHNMAADITYMFAARGKVEEAITLFEQAMSDSQIADIVWNSPCLLKLLFALCRKVKNAEEIEMILPILQRFSRHEHPYRRVHVALGLHNLATRHQLTARHREVVLELIQQLANDEDAMVREYAAFALSELKRTQGDFHARRQ